jgi:integrase
MAFINYYLDKPFSPDVAKVKVKELIAECAATNKPYPKSILNDKQTALYLFFTFEKGSRIKIKTNYRILPEQWDFKKGKYKSSLRGSLELNNELDTLSNSLLKQFSKLKDEHKILESSDILKMLDSAINVKVSAKPNSLTKARADFQLKKQQVLTEGTLKEYRTVFKSLDDYQEAKKMVLTFQSFNQPFFNDYEKFLLDKVNPYKEERGLLNDTIAKYCATLKSFLQWAYENKYHSNVDGFSKIKTQIKRKSKNEIVALTEGELFQILNHDFSEDPKLEKVRDLFCFGCFTGQRFSDIMRFNQDDFDGKKWSFVSIKTKKNTIVPFTGFIAKALPIMKKFNYVFPEISNQKFNEYLKDIGKEAKIDTPIRIIRFSGVSEVQIRQPKHEFMSSHMARRTFVTLMLEKGVPITVIQKITQHSDIRTLLKYEGHGENALFESLKNT